LIILSLSHQLGLRVCILLRWAESFSLVTSISAGGPLPWMAFATMPCSSDVSGCNLRVCILLHWTESFLLATSISVGGPLPWMAFATMPCSSDVSGRNLRVCIFLHWTESFSLATSISAGGPLPWMPCSSDVNGCNLRVCILLRWTESFSLATSISAGGPLPRMAFVTMPYSLDVRGHIRFIAQLLTSSSFCAFSFTACILSSRLVDQHSIFNDLIGQETC